MAGKYAPLELYLRDLPQTQKEVTLAFAQIEKILKSKLPSSPPPPALQAPPQIRQSCFCDAKSFDVEFGGGRVGVGQCGLENR